MPAQSKKSKKSKERSWQWVVGNIFLSAVVFLGLLLISIFVFSLSIKGKQYFTPQPEDHQGITPFIGDDFFETCNKRLFYCFPSTYSRITKGWYTSCQCFRPNVATYLLAPVLVASQYLHYRAELERMLFPIFFHAVFVFILTRLIFLREKNLKKKR